MSKPGLQGHLIGVRVPATGGEVAQRVGEAAVDGQRRDRHVGGHGDGNVEGERADAVGRLHDDVVDADLVGGRRPGDVGDDEGELRVGDHAPA